MQVALRSDKLKVMAKNASNPESVSDLRHEVRGLNQVVEKLRQDLENKKGMSWWVRIGEHKVIAGLIVAAIIAVCAWAQSALHSQANEYVDGRIGNQVKPISTQLTTINERTSRIEGTLAVLQAQLVAQKYATVPPKELKAHSEELKQLKTTMAQLPPTSSGYWPLVFQVIQLASQSTFADVDKIAAQGQSEYSNVSSRPPGGFGVIENRRVILKNHVEGLIFKNCIIFFDPTVELVNDVFINCVFMFPTQENPSKPLQEIGKTLLASDLSKVTLNAS
jgi:hypothetical protein